jgi:hypothetical protein
MSAEATYSNYPYDGQPQAGVPFNGEGNPFFTPPSRFWQRKPNVVHPEDIEGVLDYADWTDAASPMHLQMWSGGAYILSDPESDREPTPEDCLWPDERSGFRYVAIRSLAKTLRSAKNTTLKKGMAVLLDQARGEDLKDVYRVRIAHSELEFAFHSLIEDAAVNVDAPITPEEISDDEYGLLYAVIEKSLHPYKHPEPLVHKIMAEGLFRFFTSDLTGLRESAQLIGAIGGKRAAEIDEWQTSLEHAFEQLRKNPPKSSGRDDFFKALDQTRQQLRGEELL